MDNKLSKAAKSSSNKDLPNEIIYEIQLRLPVKSLIRFCCVSKDWHFTIISDPKFRKSHFKLASQQQTLSRRLLIMIASPKETPSFGERHGIRIGSIPFPIRSTLWTEPITLGSCNGLIFLLYNDWEICLWNPTTNKVQSLPSPSPPHDIREISIVLGFGYVSDTDDYKLVLSSIHVDGFVVNIFSFRDKSWKRKESPPDLHGVVTSSPFHCVNSNQALHWPRSTGPTGQSLLAFDLVEEEFREIQVPFARRLHAAAHVSGDISIGDLSGCLCVADLPLLECIQLWVMREYNVPETWTKLFKLYVGPDFTKQVFFSESCIFVKQCTKNLQCYLKRFDHQGENLDDEAVVCTGQYKISEKFTMTQYDESLLQLDDYLRTN